MNTRSQNGLLLGDKGLGPFQYTPKECAIWHCQRQYDQPAFNIEMVNEEIGKGVFARQDFDRGQFLFEYQGELLTHDAGLKREKEYPLKFGSYMYFFTFQGEYHCIDATRHECVGKYANDATGPSKNAFPKILHVEGRPHICLFACRRVERGEEIRYDYGVPNLPWRRKTHSKRPFAHQTDNKSVKGKKRKQQQIPKAPSEDVAQINPPETSPAPANYEEQSERIVQTLLKAPSIKDVAQIDPPETSPAPANYEEQSERIVQTLLKAPSEDVAQIDQIDPLETSPAPANYEEQSERIVQTLLKAPSEDVAQIDQIDPPETSPAPANYEEQSERIVQTLLKAPSEDVAQIDQIDPETSPAPANYEEQSERIVQTCEVNTLDVVEDSCDSSHSSVFPCFGSSLKPLAQVKPRCRLTKLPQGSSERVQQEADHDTDLSDDTDGDENDDSDYIPEEESESEPESEGEDRFLDENETRSKSDHRSTNPLDEETCSISKVGKDGTNVKGNLRVPSVQKSKTRIWDKQHCCVFCMELKSKIPRHFEQVHKNELEVAKFLALPKKSAERSKAIEELRRKGDFAHNTEVLRKAQGSIIPCRRPNSDSKESASNFIPCENCLGFFLAKDLWRHKKNCVHGREKNSDKERGRQSKRGTHQSTSAALLPVSDETKSEMKTQILNTMANDDISMVARTDSLIVQFGSKLFFKTGQEKHQHQYIKQKLRELSRFLLAMRKLCPSVWSLTDCIDPVMFKNVTEAVKNECGYDPNTGRYQIPSLALKLGHSLMKCAKCLKSTALQLQDKAMRAKAEDFQELMGTDWQCEISSQALATLHTNTFNKPKRLPLTDHIRKLNILLQEKASSCTEALKNSATESNYQDLSQVTQAQLVLFNRRRGGEIERIPVSQYAQGMNKEPLQEDIAASLSPFEKQLANSLHRLEIRGKRGRKVPVLFTKRLKEQVDLLVQNRAACGILEQSLFLFSRVGNCKTPYRSCDALSKFAEQCGAKKPHLLQSTNLRFHIGTVSQILNLRENELDILAGFMGHDIRVHRQFYRLPDDTLQLAKVSKILMELENGRIEKHKGKSLDEIEIAEDETVNDDEMRNTTEDGPETVWKDGSVESEEEPSEPETESSSKHKSGGRRKKVTSTRRPWTEAEKEAVFRQLSKFIRIRKVPGKRECEDAKSKETALMSRPWTQIKFFIKNILTSKRVKNNL